MSAYRSLSPGVRSVLTALRNMTGSTPDVRIVQGCLRDLVDSGLIRRTGTDHYQRIQVEKKTKPQEPKMGEPAKKIETQSEQKRFASAGDAGRTGK